MKKNFRLIVFVLSLSAVVCYLFFNEKSFTIKPELRDFAIDDTSIVEKIFLSDKAGNSVTLEKNSPGNWIVNKKYQARNDAVKTLLYTMLKLEVKNPVAKAARDNVLKHMSANATKVEIYQRSRPPKIYYVGGATQDQLGTFMLIENSSEPFVMYIPDFTGYLTTRYFTGEAQWRSRLLISLEPDEIKNISVSYPSQPEMNFEISSDGKNNFSLSQNATPSVLGDTLLVRQYFSFFYNLQCENFANGMKQEKRDSLLATQPQCIVSVSAFDGTKKEMKFFLMLLNELSLVKENENGPLKYDADRMYALLDGKEFAVIQHFVFGKVMRSWKDFSLPKK